MVLTHAKLLELFPLKLVFPKNPDMAAVMLDVMRAAIAGPPPPPPERPDKDVLFVMRTHGIHLHIFSSCPGKHAFPLYTCN